MRQRVIAKFLVIFTLVFVLATGISLFWMTEKRVSEAEDLMAARIGTQVARAASEINFAETTVSMSTQFNTALAPLLSDPAFVCADVLLNGEPVKGLLLPKRLGCLVMAPPENIAIPLSGKAGGVLRVGFNNAEIDAVRSAATWAGLTNAALAVLVSVAIGLFAFRYSVGKPVRNLLDTVRSVASDGKFRHAYVRNKDEIGELCEAFNTMQDRLELEQMRTVNALDRIDHMYNTTPALLFTLSVEGVIATVSDHWLAETGYSRQEVAEKPLERFVCPDSRNRLKSSVLHELRQGSHLREVPMRLWCKDGKEIDVLLSTTPDRRSGNSKSFVCVMNDVTLLRSAERNLRSLALTDPLTSLPNRLGLADFLANCSAKSRTVFFIDLDNFKSINDTCGHNAGDKALRESANRIREVIGDAGIVARIGGDEFAVALPNLADRNTVAGLATQIVERLSVPIMLEHSTGHIGASVGIAICEDMGRPCEEAIRQADQAMYVAKHEGKNRFAFYQEAAVQEVASRAIQVQMIQSGLEQKRFDVVFQPIVDLYTMRPVAVEALLRLNHVGCPFRSTEEIIRVAEESGQMVQLGEWILAEACDHFKDIQAKIGSIDLSISVNLSPQQLTEGFVQKVRKILHVQPELSGKLIFEVTETAAIKRFDVVEGLLRDLRSVGVRIAIDDFGSGYSSLGYISRLPVDLIKLDKSFVQMALGAGESHDLRRKQLALMKTMATLAQELELKVVVEGLESAESVEIVKAMGMDFGQGYVFAQPMPKEVAALWLSSFVGKENVRKKSRELKLLRA